MSTTTKASAYEVTVLRMFGDLDYRKLFWHEADARECYESLIAHAKKDECRVKPGDGYGKNFVRSPGDEEFNPDRIESCCFKQWYSCSGETEEQDVTEDTIILSRVHIFPEL